MGPGPGGPGEADGSDGKRETTALQWGPVPEDQERNFPGLKLGRISELQWGPVPEDQERTGRRVRRTVTTMLQWGPVPEDQERKEPLDTLADATRASMGPGPGGPGEAPRASAAGAASPSFNGARSRRTRRGRVGAVHQRARLDSSMGPGPGGPGEVPANNSFSVGIQLQWGPVPEDQERLIYVDGHPGLLVLQWGPVPEDQERGRRPPHRTIAASQPQERASLQARHQRHSSTSRHICDIKQDAHHHTVTSVPRHSGRTSTLDPVFKEPVFPSEDADRPLRVHPRHPE